MGLPNKNKKTYSNNPRSVSSYFFRTRPMPYGNVLLEAISLSFSSLSIHRSIDARRSARRARIRYLQLKTHGKFEYSQAFNELWRLVEEEAEADSENMKNNCASGYTLKKTEKRKPDWDDDAGAGGAAANVSAWRAKSHARSTYHTHD